MEKRILCVVDRYYPNESADTICAIRYLSRFIDEGYEIDYYVLKMSPQDVPHKENNGSVIYYARNFLVDMAIKKKKKLNLNTYHDVPKIKKKILNIIGSFFVIGKCRTSNWIVDSLNHKKAIKFFTKQHKIKPYEFVFSFSAPYALSIGARKIAKSLNVLWIPVFLDAFVYNPTLSTKEKDIKKRKIFIEKELESASKVFAIYGIKKFNKECGYNPNYHKKVIDIHQPNLIENKHKEKEAIINKKKVNLCYTGRFYDDIRNPEKMLEILLGSNTNLCLTVIGDGCEEILQKYKRSFGDRLNLIPRQPYNECQKYMDKADILINLGNTIVNQVPSKVLEYISTGKAIINFYFSKQDSSLYYLKKYSNCLNIYLKDDIQKNIIKINNFCRLNASKVISFNKATEKLKDCIMSSVVDRFRSNV